MSRAVSADDQDRKPYGLESPVGSGGTEMCSESVIREEHRLRVDGETVAAWIYRPQSHNGAGPCVILGHGFAAVRRAGLDAFAQRFSQAGITAVAFDYRHFGDSSGEPRGLISIAEQLKDWREVLKYVTQLDGVDPERIAIWGTSFAGGHAISLAASESSIAAVIAQVPFMDGLLCMRAMGYRQAFRLGVAAVADLLRTAIGGKRVWIRVVGPPGSLAAMTTPDSEPGYMAMVNGVPWTNAIPASAMLYSCVYRPIRLARKAKCPVLLCIADNDAITPPQGPLRAARKMSAATVLRYPAGHFDVYRGRQFEEVVRDQIAFLRASLKMGEPAGNGREQVF